MFMFCFYVECKQNIVYIRQMNYFVTRLVETTQCAMSKLSVNKMYINNVH